jgi:rhamnose utilization protein RhaD (predicted bifunctional aldolase and dehydrogenase)
MSSTPIDDAEFHALRELSAALGADPLRTQGAGGNTSIKRDGVMWIKASGTWLADALAHDIMTPVRLEPLRKAIVDGDPRAAAAVDFVDSAPVPAAFALRSRPACTRSYPRRSSFTSIA